MRHKKTPIYMTAMILRSNHW